MLSIGATSIRSFPGISAASYHVSTRASGYVVFCTKRQRLVPLAGVGVVHPLQHLGAVRGRAAGRGAGRLRDSSAMRERTTGISR